MTPIKLSQESFEARRTHQRALQARSLKDVVKVIKEERLERQKLLLKRKLQK